MNDATRQYLDWLGGEGESEEIEDEEAEEFGLANGTWQYDTYDEVTTEESVDDVGDKTTTTRTTTKRGKGHPKTSGSLLPEKKNKNKATLLP